MREKVILVLFDDPYVDVEAAALTVGSPSYALLKSTENILTEIPTRTSGNMLRFDPALIAKRDPDVGGTPKEADIVPFSSVHHTTLTLLVARPSNRAASNSMPQTTARQAATYAAVPTRVKLKSDDHLIATPQIADRVSAVLGSFGSSLGVFLGCRFRKHLASIETECAMALEE
ncbi:hypothetical protein BJX62DRAFT_243432 [Aspergillus germanicus]